MNTTKQTKETRKHRKPVKPVVKVTSVHHWVAVDEIREVAQPEASIRQAGEGDGDLGEALGQDYVANMTGADDAAIERGALDTLEDEGGPFVITTGATEFAHDVDASNPIDAEREALPTVSPARKR